VNTILHLIETCGPGGAERMLVGLVERLDRARYRSIICLQRDGWLRSELEKRGCETVILPQRGVLDVRWLSGVTRLIKQRGVSLMHTHEFAMNTYGTLVSILTRTPLVSTVHGKNYYPERWRRRVAYRWVARRAAMVAVSEDLNRFLRSRLGLGEREVVTLYNGVDADACRPRNGAGRAIRSELGLAGRPVVGTIGNLYSVKGHRYLLEAAALVAEAMPDAAFLVVGRGDLLAALQQTARALGVEERVFFLGYRPDVPGLLQAMDVFVLPSLSEGLPLSLLEAMGAGKPVVATAVGGIPEVVADGETGLLVPPADAGALAQGILRLLAHAELADRLGQRARLRAEERFSMTSMVRAYEALYARRLGNGSCL
jgi:glycosyltransferase involved in cell wall biosynthesis